MAVLLEELINISQVVADIIIILSFLFIHVQILLLTKHVGKMLCTQLCEQQIQKRPDQFVREIRCVAIKFWVSSRAPGDLAFLENSKAFNFRTEWVNVCNPQRLESLQAYLT